MIRIFYKFTKNQTILWQKKGQKRLNDKELVLPSANSMMLIEKIPGAWLIQFKEGGHLLMSQYPERLSAIVDSF